MDAIRPSPRTPQPLSKFELEKYLTDDEQRRLIQLRQLAEHARSSAEESNHPLRMTLPQLIQRWITIHRDIIGEFVNFTSGFQGKYGIYFQDIDQSKQWFQGILLIIGELIGFFTKEDRGIYVGITLIIISLWIYFLHIAE